MPYIRVDFWTLLAWTTTAAWCSILAVFVLASRRRAVLRPLTSAVSADMPRLSVIVAAKNEEECIETCIRSLFRQDYPNFEVVAVNDRSSDATAAILDRLAIEFEGQLRVVHVSMLPPGWFGKPHALTLGQQVADGSLICFTDADCEFHSAATLRTTVVEMQNRSLDLLTITAVYTMDSWRESVTVPCCSEALMLWLRPERVDDPNTDDVFANGAFMLVRRQSFDEIGGWGAVRSQISEDLQLARHAKRSGLRLGVAQGPGFYTTRSYATARDSWNGWSRIFNGTLNRRQLAITLVRMSVLFVLPLATTIGNIAQSIQMKSWAPLAQGAGLAFALALGMRTALDIAMFRIVDAPMAAALLAPLGRLFVMAASLRALLSHWGLANTHWRGATFSSGQLVMPQPVAQEARIQDPQAA